MNRGKYIVLEGPEGVGKTTQIEELAKRLEAAGLPVRTLREPDSQTDLTARAIRHLTQDPHYPMSTRTEVLLYNAARAQSLEIIKQSVEQGVICLVDRNYLTTLAVQYYGRGDVPDYTTINTIINFAVGDIEPDLCIVMDAPVQTLRARLTERDHGERFDSVDDAFLERVRAGYLWEARQRSMPVIFATDSREEVADAVWAHVTRELAVRKGSAATSVATPISEVLAKKELPAPHEPPFDTAQATNSSATTEPRTTSVEASSDNKRTTESGKDFLEAAVTSVDGNVYAFTNKLPSTTIAAAMARLCRSSDDMRITLVDEFSKLDESNEAFMQRVMSDYGDGSVQQLGGAYLVVENASNLLTKKLEWGRLAAYLEQSTRYIYFDKKDANGHYKYYTPAQLDNDTKAQYQQIMDSIFDEYAAMVHKLADYLRAHSSVAELDRDTAWDNAIKAQACDAIRPVLPVATTSTVGIFASGQSIESLITHLKADELDEARITGDEILTQARKVMPTFLERVDKLERGGAAINYMANTKKAVSQLAREYLAGSHASSSDEAVSLVDYWPKNELLLVPDMLYEHSNLSLEQLQTETSTWSYDKKATVLQTYMGERQNRRHRPGRALEKAHYSWDIVCDYGIFRDLQRHRMVDDLAWQELTPRYGYEVPQIIEDAGLTDNFEACFDASLKLHSILQGNGYALEAQYATLLGHRMRWKVTYNAREAFHIHELRTIPQGHPGYRKLVKAMHEKLADVHPLLAESMTFVNKGDDPELTRLDSERDAQARRKEG